MDNLEQKRRFVNGFSVNPYKETREMLDEIKKKAEKKLEALIDDFKKEIQEEIQKVKEEMADKEPMNGLFLERMVNRYADKVMKNSLTIRGNDGKDGMRGEDGHTPTRQELLSIINPLIPIAVNGRDGKDGRTPTKEELLPLITPLIPEVKDGESPSDEKLISLITPLIPQVKDGSPDTPDDVVEKINKSEKAIDFRKIKGINEIFDSFKNEIRRLMRGGGGEGGGGGMGTPQHQTFSCNGVLTTFTLTYNVAAGGNAILGFYNGQQIVKGTHYSISGKTVTTTFTPENGTSLDFVYWRT